MKTKNEYMLSPKIGSLFLLLVCLLNVVTCFSQLPEQKAEQKMESIVESNGDEQSEDDSYTQTLADLSNNRLDINSAEREELMQLSFLSPVQINNILSYRKIFGLFINMYELQAVPTLDIATIEKMLPYLIINQHQSFTQSFKERLHGGSHLAFARVSQLMEKQAGYRKNTGNYYSGSPQHYLIRYRYQFKNLLQYGFTADKDAGESFFSGRQKTGFDFYSAHLFIRNIGCVKSLTLGDFTVNMGQGLLLWQSMAFRKSADVLNIKRQSSTLRPYNSAGEYNFHRGIGITIGWRSFEITSFASVKQLDANLNIDSSSNTLFVSSLQQSGLHRTAAEEADKGVLRQLATGAAFTWRINKLELGLNCVFYKFNMPIVKSSIPYNPFAVPGSLFTNSSIHYGYTWKNLHAFGEWAMSKNGKKAMLNGVLLSVSPIADISLLYRNIDPGYQSFYSNAFTETSTAGNEKGLYTGLSLRPHPAWKLDAYADLYKFPWLSFRANKPSAGADYLVQIDYKPSKQLEIYGRFRTETKPINQGAAVADIVVPEHRRSFRLQVNTKLNSVFILRSRLELAWFENAVLAKETGTLVYTDIIYKPMLSRLSGGIRVQYFDCDSYNSRLYAYENDVLYSFTVPVFYDRGSRWYINLNYDVSKHLSVWFRLAQTIFNNKNSSGSGLDEISGNRRTEIKIQFQYVF